MTSRHVFPVLAYAALFIAAVVTFVSHEWGATPHSLFSLAVFGVIVGHVALQRHWVRAVARRVREHRERRLAIYNAVFAAVLVTCIVTGFPVWLAGTGGPVAQVHDITGFLFVPMALVHLVLNRGRLRALVRRRTAARASG